MVSSGSGGQDPPVEMAPPVSGDAGEAQAAVADDWAICCSGGGIRSAAYCLGALQSLDEGGVLSKSKWILGVSGEAPGTPEERNLRYNTRYIAPNGATVLVGLFSLLLAGAATRRRRIRRLSPAERRSRPGCRPAMHTASPVGARPGARPGGQG